VREITVGPNGMADGVIYYDENGAEQRQKAEVIVIACNGVGTPRLLLNSRSPQFPDGLANRSGLVGRNLMFHPYSATTGHFEQPLEGYKGPFGCSLWSHEFYETDASRGFVRGFMFESGRGFPPVFNALWALSHGRLPWGDSHHTTFAALHDRVGGIVAICEDLPDPANRVTLDERLTDSNGIPAPKITYRLSENSQKMLAFSIARATEVLKAAGARDVLSESPWKAAGWHLMGTARMGADPARSVVNEWGRCHDVRNVFIVDGSIFVTSAGVNPCSTIQALALYIADTMKKNLANLFD
jgi:choline dehydrogenase-like flavoprotein